MVGGGVVLDRTSFVPLYFQLAEVLKQRLETGSWEAGARFPSEHELEAEFGVSRTVIRPALNLLVGDGAIVRVKGSGTFVTPPKREVALTGLVRVLVDAPDRLGLRVLRARKQTPDTAVAKFLQIGSKPEPVVHINVLFLDEELPVCLVDSYSRYAEVPWMLAWAQALESGEPRPAGADSLGLTRSRGWVEGTFLSQFGASQLGVSAGAPTLLGRLVQFAEREGSGGERPIEFARLIYRSDSVQLAIGLD